MERPAAEWLKVGPKAGKSAGRKTIRKRAGHVKLEGTSRRGKHGRKRTYTWKWQIKQSMPLTLLLELCIVIQFVSKICTRLSAKAGAIF